MGVACCAAKCCGCLLLSQLLGVLIPLALLAAAALAFKYYALPWGEDQIREALGLASDVDVGSLNASYVDANSCSGCVFGANTQWPTNSTGLAHFLDSSAGSTASGAVAVSIAAGAAAGVGSMLWASIVPSAATGLSLTSGFYEMTHIFEQAQFIGMISQLQIDGAPEFLYQFSKELAWTNFNIPKASSTSDDGSGSGSASDSSDGSDETTRRRLSLVSAAQESGPARYAEMIGVETEDLFFYTLMTFAIVLAAIHVLFVLGVVVMGALSKKESFGDVAKKLYRKVIWAAVLALLLAQYIFSMAGFYYASQGTDSAPSSGKYYLGVALLAVVVIFAVMFGVLVVANNTEELRDVGTYEHDQRPFSSKYSAYYDEYNFDNRFFFVPRILLAVSTGAVVGVVTDSTVQLLCILGITVLYLILLLVREPNLLRFLYYIGITSVFMKVVLVCMMLIVARDDYFPQSVRDSVAYGIIGVNMFIFLLLFLRQAYTIIHKMVVACRHKKNGGDSNSDTDINLEGGNNFGASNNQQRGYSRMDSTPAYNQQNGNTNPNAFNNNYNNYGHNQYAPQSQANDYNFQQKLQQEQIPMLELSSNSNKPGNNYNYGNDGGYAYAGAAPTNGNFAAPSRNNQYNFDGSQGPRSERLDVSAKAPAPPKPAPQYDVLAAYLGTANTTEEDSYTTSPKATSGAAGLARQSTRLSRVSTRPNDARVSAFRDSSVYNASFSGDESFVSAVSSSTALQAQQEQQQQQRQLRSGSVDIDDGYSDDDIVSEPPLLGSTLLAPSTSGSDDRSAGQPPSDRSYLAFTDSSIGSSSFGEASNHEDLGASRVAPGRTEPQVSIFSNGDSSFGGDSSDWFLRRSKTELEAEDSDRDSYDVDSIDERDERITETPGSSRDTTVKAEAYLKDTSQGTNGRGENDIGGDDYDSDSGSDAIMDAPRGTNESFMSARSDDEINFYFAGDRSTQVLQQGATTQQDAQERQPHPQQSQSPQQQPRTVTTRTVML